MEIKKEESWNKKRIFAAFFLIIALIIGGYFIKTKVLGSNSFSPSDLLRSVKGTSSVKEDGKVQEKGLNTFNVQKPLQEKLESLKREVSGLNILEVASSSPQVQKIINDIKSLEQYPTNQVKEICEKVCSGL